MQLNNLTVDDMSNIVEALRGNINASVDYKETLTWVKKQFIEQQKGGPWKARLREAGHVI